MPRFTPPIAELKPQPSVFHIPPSMLEVGMILKSAVVVDTSAKNEYDAKHITGAISIPAGNIATRAKRLPKDKQIVFYGSDMEQAERAARELLALGFTKVSVLEGGLPAWENARLPMTRQKAVNRRDKLTVQGERDSQ
jgi:rhodanese-related sulfurtransferase